jgi:membrane protease YdiL (CAAX protease family)
MHDTNRRLGLVDGVLIFGISFLVLTIASVSLTNLMSIRANAAVSAVVVIAVAAFLLKVSVGSYFGYSRIRRVRPTVMFYSIVASLAILLPTLSIESFFVRHFPIPPQMLEDLSAMLRAESLLDLIYVWAVVALGAAISEEFIFRGVLQNCLTDWTTGWVAVLITSLVFGILHTVYRLPPAFILGALLGVIYLRTGSILTVVAGHTAINTVTILLFHLTRILEDQSLPAWIIEDGEVPAWTVGGSLIVFTVAMTLLWRATKPPLADHNRFTELP